MQLSLPFIDIIIFAIIAIFLVYRLKSILGQNSDGSEQNNKIDLNKKNFNNVVKLEKKDVKTNDTQDQKNALSKIDPTFNEKEFLKGAQNFFEMVIASFVKGNLENILNYVDSKLIKNFQSVIDERREENVTILKHLVRISVLFESEQIKVLKDKKGTVIDGDQNNSILVRDLWTFEREIQSKNLNWQLVETSDA